MDNPHFDGVTYEPERDHIRLTGQLGKVFEYMSAGGWVTIAEVAQAVVGSEGGAAARMRDLRKPKFGGFTVERRRVNGGLFEYRLLTDPQYPLF